MTDFVSFPFTGTLDLSANKASKFILYLNNYLLSLVIELTADNRCDHVEKVTLIRLVYLQKYPNEALEDCNVDSETIVPG